MGNLSKSLGGFGGRGTTVDPFRRHRGAYTRQGVGGTSLTGGVLNFDPRIGSLRDQSLNTIRGATSDFRGRLDDIRRRLLDNATGLESAYADPVRREGALRESQIRNNLGRRGLGGSSFFDQALSGNSADFAQREGEQRALARQQILQALTGLSEGELQALQNQGGYENQAAQQLLNQDLQGLGVTSGNIGMITGSDIARQQRMIERRKAIANTITSAFSISGANNNTSSTGGFTEMGER